LKALSSDSLGELMERCSKVPRMNAATWRAVILTLCALTALASVATILCNTGFGGRPPWSGREGFGSDLLASEPFALKVREVEPGGPAWRAGIRHGDVIDLRTSSLQDRYWIDQRPLSGRQITLQVRRGSRYQKVSVVAEPASRSLTQWTLYAEPLLSLWLALFAALIAWRRPKTRELWLLPAALAVYALSILGTNLWATPWVWMSVAADFYTDVAGPLAVALWVAFASSFAGPLSRSRRVVQWFSYAMAGIASVQAIATSVGFITLRFDPNALANTSPIPSDVLTVVALISTILAIVATRGAERQRAVWTLVPLAILLSVPSWPVYQIVFSVAPPSYLAANLYYIVQDAISLLAPIALTYAALSRRLIDVGFVLNRAAVFSGVSLIVVGLFMLVEWVIGTWFSRTSHMTSLEVGAALAICLGFSVRVIHARVDRVLDHLFFRKRHADEVAIRAFAGEAADATDSVTLVEQTKEALKVYADASFVTIIVNDGHGRYGGVSENDAAIAALRARRKVLDLQTISTEVRGEFAYPMVARGQLVGALVLGPKRSGESYAPDESDAIMQLAHEVGSALHILSLAKVLQQHHLQA
jgi:hypothetical protein